MDRSQGIGLEGVATLFLRDDAVVAQGHLGVKPIGEHAFIFPNQFVVDADITEIDTRKFDEVAVVLCGEPGFYYVDDPNRPDLSRPRFEEFLFAGPNRSILQLLFNNLESLGDLLLIDAGTVAAKQEFDYVSGDRVLVRIPSDKVFSDQISVEYRCCEFIQMIEFHCHVSSPTVVGLESSTRPV